MKRILNVEGMTCSHCELTIDTRLLAIPGVIKAESSYVKNKVYIEYLQDLLSMDELMTAIEDLGYHVATGKSNDLHTKIISTISLLFLLLLSYLILRFNNRLSFNFIPAIRQNMGYGSLFLVGIISSLHCVAMCGSICMSQRSRGRTKITLHPSFLYNLGRLVSYTLIGGIVGGIGSILSFNGQIRGYITLFVSLIMLLLSLKMIRLFPNFLPNAIPLRNLQRNHFVKLQHYISQHTRRSPFLVGLANGFMPCGPLQSIQLYALGTGNVIEGALSMFYFSLGTFPLMFGIGFISNLIHHNFSRTLQRFSGLLIFILALTMFSRGATLAGIILPIEPSEKAIKSSLTEQNLQEVRITLTSNSYPSIQVLEDIPVKLILEVDEKNLNGCNNPLTIPEYQVEKTLVPGENILYFYPKDSGKNLYTCWMGMIRGTIEVVPNNE